MGGGLRQPSPAASSVERHGFGDDFVKGRELEALYRKYLLAHLPDFAYKGPLLFVRPVVHLLRGFSFERSSFNANAFQIVVFVQPLYVPADYITFVFRKYPHGRWGARWTLDRQDEGATMTDVLASIKAEGLPFLSRVQTPRDQARNAPLVAGDANGLPAVQTMAYSFVLAREYSEATVTIDRLQAMLRAADLTDPWVNEMLTRSEQVRERLERDPEEAIALLEEWIEQTRSALRLPKD
jgi:hypothetical protein